MKRNAQLFVFTIVQISILSSLSAQKIINKQDTVNDYLIEKCKILLEPHSDLNFSFGTDELKNDVPDLKVKIPDLKDTTKFFDELKGNYNDWHTFYEIGRLYQRFNRNQSAFAYFDQAYNLILNEIKKDSTNSNYYSAMGSLYMNLKSTENAFYFFNKAYELNDKDSLASLFLPMFYIFSGNLEKADELISKKIHNEPDQINSYIWLITSKVFKTIANLDKTDKSLLDKSIDELFDFSDLSTAVEKNKHDIRFLVLEQLGRQLALFAKFGVLADDFEKVELKPNDVKELKAIRKSLEKFLSKGKFKNKYILYKTLGFNYLLNHDIDKAIEMFKKSIASWPADKISKDYYILFTTHYFLQNDTAAALSVIDTKIKNDSALMLLNVMDYVLKGNVFLAKNEYQKASNCFQESLEIRQNVDAWLGLAFIALKDGGLTEANKLINSAYELNKEYYLTYALFGVITLMNNQTDAAKDAMSKALELKPDDKTIKELYNAFFKE